MGFGLGMGEGEWIGARSKQFTCLGIGPGWIRLNALVNYEWSRCCFK
jgi:hypothetical protein